MLFFELFDLALGGRFFFQRLHGAGCLFGLLDFFFKALQFLINRFFRIFGPAIQFFLFLIEVFFIQALRFFKMQVGSRLNRLG